MESNKTHYALLSQRNMFLSLKHRACYISPMEKTIGKRIKEARINKGLSQIELSRLCGWESQSRISGYERDEREPKQRDIKVIAENLGVAAAWLSTGEADRTHYNVAEERRPYQASPRRAPLISWVQAGDWQEAIDLFQPGDGESSREVPLGTSENAFWLRVVGDSMTNPHGSPSVPEGSMILVEPEIAPDNGKLVVARLVDTSEVTFKRLIIDAGRKWLKPLNPQYPMIEINGNCEIIGVVKKMEIDL